MSAPRQTNTLVPGFFYHLFIILVAMPSLAGLLMCAMMYLIPIHGFEHALYWAIGLIAGAIIPVGVFCYKTGVYDAERKLLFPPSTPPGKHKAPVLHLVKVADAARRVA